MRIFAVADFHGDSHSAELTAERAAESGADMIIVVGDITHFGSVGEARSLLRTTAKAGLPIFFVPGNCDDPMMVEQIADEGLFCLHGRQSILGSAHLIGVGGSPRGPFSTPFELDEDEVRKALESAFQPVPDGEHLILVTHAPPYGTKIDVTHLDEHVGSRAIRSFVEAHQPILAVSGHIHESKGIDRIGRSHLVNPGPASHGFYALADLNGDVRLSMRLF